MAETTLIAETFSFNDRAGGRRGNSILPTLKPNRLTEGHNDRPTDEKRAFRDNDDACEGEIRGHGEDESLVERESERGLS